MHPAGAAVVASARADGYLNALDQVEDLVEPADLSAALDADPAARTEWDDFPRSTRQAILEWIGNAREVEALGLTRSPKRRYRWIGTTRPSV